MIFVAVFVKWELHMREHALRWRKIINDCFDMYQKVCIFVPCLISNERYLYETKCYRITTRIKISGIETTYNGHCQAPWKLVVDGPELYTCTSKMLPSGEENNAFGNFWCATSVNDDLTYKDWNWCSSKYRKTSIYCLIVGINIIKIRMLKSIKA